MQKRPAARLLVLDPENRVLLFQFVFDDGPLAGERYWATPGGALEQGESYLDAAKRELLEETGITTPIGILVLEQTVVFRIPSGESVSADERYFLVRVINNYVDQRGQCALERKHMKTFRWWTLQDLAETSDVIYPRKLVELIERQTESK